MLKREREKIKFLEFELFQEFDALIHGCFMRDTGTDHHSIQTALSRTQQPPTIVSGHQVHGTQVYVVENNSLPPPECDALITNVPGLALMIKHADCQAALFFDPINRAIGAVHSGWRGSVQNIYQTTVEAMQREFGTQPEELRVAISPSLGPDASQFINYKTELPEEFHPFQYKPLYFDFWEISRMQLTRAGVRKEHIQIAEMCTVANPDKFFSYRYDKTKERNATLIGLEANTSSL